MADTYYQYKDVAELVVHRLLKIDGWNVGSYHETEIDGYTDYYNPFHWCGVAEKNGYKFVFNQPFAKETRTYKVMVKGGTLDKETRDKIAKLERMTTDRGATPAEEATAKAKIEVLKNKVAEGTQYEERTEEGHMANPPRCNWHIEKDGIIIDKGTGVLKFSGCPDTTDARELEQWQDFNNLSKEELINKLALKEISRWNESEERAREIAESHYNNMVKKYALLDKFNEWIAKINNTCGGMVGNNGEEGFYTYKEVVKTEYKTEIKPQETTSGSVKDGQCFILKSSFNYGRNKGYIYKITATTYDDGKIIYHAYKMNGKNTKICTGSANQANSWYIGSNPELLTKWIDKGAIAWCELVEVKTPYEVKKVVKEFVRPESKKAEKKTTTPKTERKKAATTPTPAENDNVFTVEESEHTKTHEKLYLVKCLQSLSREQYNNLNNIIKQNGGYYSKFTHSFIFKENPTELLKGVKIA